MTKAEVMSLLEENRNERGEVNWEKLGDRRGGLKSFGIGLTQLRKLSKQVGRDHRLAGQLWKTKNHDAKVVGLLIDDPKSITIDQAESQVEQLQGGYLAHVFSSCDATLAKAPFVVELADKWIVSKDPVRQRCGYGLLYEISKDKKKSAPDDDYFLKHISLIEDSYPDVSVNALMSMGGALMGIGKRNKKLNAEALRVARKIGPIDFDPDGRCDPMDITKHLTSDYLKKKLGI